MDNASKAARADVRLIDFDAPIVGFGGKPISEVNEKTGETLNLTLRMVCAQALNTMTQKDEDSPRIRFLRGHLSIAIDDGEISTLTGEELALVKDTIGRAWPPLVVKRAYTLLDPADVAKISDKGKPN